MGLAAPQHVGSSRDRICICHISRWIIYHLGSLQWAFWPMRHTDLTNTCWIMTVACNLATRWGRVLEEEARTKHHRRRENFHLVWPGRITWWVSRNFPDGYGQREFWEKKFAQVQRRMNQHTWDQVLEPWHWRTKRVFWGKWDPELSVRKTNVWKMQSEMHGDGSGRKSSWEVTVSLPERQRGQGQERKREQRQEGGDEMAVMMQWDKRWREEGMNSRDEITVDIPGWRCWLDIPEKMDHPLMGWRWGARGLESWW